MIRPSVYLVLQAISQWEDSCSSLTKGFPPISRTLLGPLALRSLHSVCRVTLCSHTGTKRKQLSSTVRFILWLPSSHFKPRAAPCYALHTRGCNPGCQHGTGMPICLTQDGNKTALHKQLSHSAPGGTQRSSLCQCTEIHKTFINTICLKTCSRSFF